ncbi:hypothetical protein HDU98_008625 [Podochytrium sp. JEL0797]|nr:hypothetical protein HDU98_008625 [Podochytrium sp. JEL0797]
MTLQFNNGTDMDRTSCISGFRGSSTCNLQWRNGAQRQIIMATDEDSDIPISNNYLLPNQGSGDAFCPSGYSLVTMGCLSGTAMIEPPFQPSLFWNSNYYRTSPGPISLEQPYYDEIQLTAKMIITNSVSLSLLMKSDFNANIKGPQSTFDEHNLWFSTFGANSSNVNHAHTAVLQYGDPRMQAQDDAFGSFSAAQTWVNLNASGLEESLQAVVLKGGGVMRVYQIEEIIDPVMGPEILSNVYHAMEMMLIYFQHSDHQHQHIYFQHFVHQHQHIYFQHFVHQHQHNFNKHCNVNYEHIYFQHSDHQHQHIYFQHFVHQYQHNFNKHCNVNYEHIYFQHSDHQHQHVDIQNCDVNHQHHCDINDEHIYFQHFDDEHQHLYIQHCDVNHQHVHFNHQHQHVHHVYFLYCNVNHQHFHFQHADFNHHHQHVYFQHYDFDHRHQHVYFHHYNNYKRSVSRYNGYCINHNKHIHFQHCTFYDKHVHFQHCVNSNKYINFRPSRLHCNNIHVHDLVHEYNHFNDHIKYYIHHDLIHIYYYDIHHLFQPHRFRYHFNNN